MPAMHFHPFTTFREWRRRTQDRRQLAGLSEEMLHDIGVSRAEALYLANKPFWRE
ncbi:MAG TPA: DUF1127 domain-containing protein [Stellaceae bacterium]|jgi:uncharacterized protein YjiS (DUF1127 family)|nr:DUF1127 domain-containing protein [Stellaceae bacterium]